MNYEQPIMNTTFTYLHGVIKYLFHYCQSRLELILQSLLFYQINDLGRCHCPCFCWMIMKVFPGAEIPVPLNHRRLARISSWTDHTLPVRGVRPFGSDVVAVAETVH